MEHFQGWAMYMYVDDFPNSVNFINRQLSSQDIAGLQRVYGITAVPEPNSIMLVSAVALVTVAIKRSTRKAN